MSARKDRPGRYDAGFRLNLARRESHIRDLNSLTEVETVLRRSSCAVLTSLDIPIRKLAEIPLQQQLLFESVFVASAE